MSPRGRVPPAPRGRRHGPAGVTEAQLQAHVTGLARLYGWRVYHPPDNRPNARGRVQRVEAGFPDLVLLRAPELLFAELKTEAGRLGPGQREWREELELVPGVEVYLWRPSDWPAIAARLGRGRPTLHGTSPWEAG